MLWPRGGCRRDRLGRRLAIKTRVATGGCGHRPWWPPAVVATGMAIRVATGHLVDRHKGNDLVICGRRPSICGIRPDTRLGWLYMCAELEFNGSCRS